MPSQFLHLGSYGVEPRNGHPRWSCISGVCAEGARTMSASKHIPFPAEPTILHGISPIEAGRIAEERARNAVDATGKRKHRRDGVALLAGVISYPAPRQEVNTDPVDKDHYLLWRNMVLAWLLAQFGEHLRSVVEHHDENYLHIHFYVCPSLDESHRLNVDHLHPGRYAKSVALAEGADKKDGERAYRAGMRRWQDAFHNAVSKFFRHDRYGPRRARVSRREREMQKKIEAERQRMIEKMEQKTHEAEYEARQRARAYYARPYKFLQDQHRRLEAAHAAEVARRRAAEAESVALRARLAALEKEASLTLVA